MQDDLKQRIDAVGRLSFAKKIGWPYFRLTNKLLGYMQWVDGDKELIESALKEVEAEKAV